MSDQKTPGQKLFQRDFPWATNSEWASLSSELKKSWDNQVVIDEMYKADPAPTPSERKL